MFSSMDMQDLGLGSLPDLDFAERLDGVYDNQDLGDGQPESDQYSSLFQELEEFNNGFMTKKDRSTDLPTIHHVEKVKSSGANILSQAVKEAAIFEEQFSPIGSNSDEDTDNSVLISEMETFLAQYEQMDAQGGVAAAVAGGGSTAVAAPLTAEESRQAEDILDALIAGNVEIDCSMDIDEGNSHTSPEPEDSGYLSDISYLGDVSNISEVVTEDGQKVVIIITNDLKEPKVVKEEPPSPANAPIKLEYSYDQESDPDWSPSTSPAPTPTSTQRKKKTVVKTERGKVEKRTTSKKRGPYKRSTYHNIKDKKERKKAQNVEAARRYRDKKKAESDSIFAEEALLAEKNKALKSKAAEIENEVKTLKKLMVELGLVK